MKKTLDRSPLIPKAVSLSLAFLLLLSLSTRADQSQDFYRRTVLFESGANGYDTYRIPALAVTTKGALLAFCEARKNNPADSGDIDLVLRRSIDNGTTWQPMQIIVDDGPNTAGNPCPIVDRRTGTIILLITRNNGNDHEFEIMKGEAPPRTVWLTKSSDEGATWSAPVDISAQVRKPDWRWYATGPCHGIQLTDGRLVAPCDHSTGPAFDELYSHVIYSDDGGDTWHIGGILDGRTDESTVVELVDGSLYLNMRNCRKTNRRAWSLSRDKGITWSPVVDDPVLVEPNCQGSILRLSTEKDGGKNRILFSNPACIRRENVTVLLSYDECKTWAAAKSLYAGPGAYSDLVVCPDKTIGCLFESGKNNPYEMINFVQFSLAWLTDNSDRM